MFNEKDLWVCAACGDSIFCADEEDVRKAYSSIQLLYDLFEKKPNRPGVSPPCYLVYREKKYVFLKEPNDSGHIIPLKIYCI